MLTVVCTIYFKGKTRMSSSQSNEGDVTITKSQVTTVSQTEVSGPKSELKQELQDLGKDLSEDFGKVSKGALRTLGGFRTFILRGNVVDLAIGIVIGAAFTTLVTSLVSDIITPLVPLPDKSSLGSLNIALPSPPYPKDAAIHVGLFVNATISFLIVAAVLYFFVVQPVSAFMKLYQPKEAEEKVTRNCPYCLQAVHHKAVRCPFCTSHLTEDKEKHEGEEPVLVLPASLEKLSEQLAEKIARKASTTATLEQHSESNAAKE
jgi:large conductance mechanosensitive channel